MARLPTVTGTGFGYPAEPFGRSTATWRQAFTAMADAVLDDAGRYRVRLSVPPDRVREMFAAAAGVLDDVVRPTLVPFDLWEGNLLLDGEAGARTLSGVIDGERMFWGDPVADFVLLALFGNVEDDADFLSSYAGRPSAALRRVRTAAAGALPRLSLPDHAGGDGAPGLSARGVGPYPAVCDSATPDGAAGLEAARA